MVRDGGRALLLLGLMAVLLSAGESMLAQEAAGLPARLTRGLVMRSARSPSS